MTARVGMRARQMEYSQPLPIVKDPNEVDESALITRDVSHAHKTLDKDNEEVQTLPKGKSAEIPIPKVERNETYDQDYPATFKVPPFYLRGAKHTDFVEYDLDDEDEDWLEQFNKEDHKLSDEQMEKLIEKLELACGAATDNALAAQDKRFAHLPQQEKEQWAASTNTLSKDKAFEAMQETGVFNPGVLAAVYDYWLDRRKRQGKPCLRRLRAPPASSDTNPYHVFRPREKIQKVQTRRRRESDEVALEKMKALQKSFELAHNLFETILRRERLKRDIVHAHCESHSLEVGLWHDPRQLHASLEQEAAKCLRRKHPEDEELKAMHSRSTLQDNRGGAIEASRRRQDGRARGGAVPPYVPPPEKPEEEMPFVRPVDMKLLANISLPSWLDRASCRARIGRCGRLVVDRVCPISLEPFTSEGEGNEASEPSIPDAPIRPP